MRKKKTLVLLRMCVRSNSLLHGCAGARWEAALPRNSFPGSRVRRLNLIAYGSRRIPVGFSRAWVCITIVSPFCAVHGHGV